MILADGLVQNGGVVHALEVLGPEIRDAIRSFLWFGLVDFADLLEAAAADSPLVDDADIANRQRLFEDVSECRSAELDARYGELSARYDLFGVFAARFQCDAASFSEASQLGNG